MNKARVYALCFGAFLVGVLVSTLVSSELAHAAPQANPHTAAPILCPFCSLDGGSQDLGARLAGKNFSRAVMPNLNSHFVNFTDTDFSGADLYNWSSRSDTVRSAVFVGANLRLGQVISSNFTQANFTNAVLIDHYFQGTNFSSANFTGANLTGAMDGGGNVFTGAIWSNTTCPDGTNSDADGGTCIGHF